MFPDVVNPAAPHVNLHARRGAREEPARRAHMFEGHNPYLVALSVAIAILGGYTGFGLAARVRGTPGVNRRLLLAGAAEFLALGIWTMHFIGMLAAPIPADGVYLVLPTIVSFLICALVVGISLFFVSIGEPSDGRVTASALLLGAGVVSMHYVGIHGLAGGFRIEHERAMVMLAALIAVGTAYGGLRIFLARQGGMRLALSAAAFGVAVSGMHYTAMYGMHFRPADIAGVSAEGLFASPDVLALVLAFLCFLITAGFLLFLVPEPGDRNAAVASGFDRLAVPEAGAAIAEAFSPDAERASGPCSGRSQPRLADLASRAACWRRGCRSRAQTAPISSTSPRSEASRPMPTTRWCTTARASECVRGRSRKPRRSSTRPSSCASTAATSWPSRTSLFVRKEGDGAIVDSTAPPPHRAPRSAAPRSRS